MTIHDTQINFNGCSGSGYTILDPTTGAGAYMIGGGLDGGSLFFGGFAGGVMAGFGLGLLVTGTVGIGLLLLVSVLLYYYFVYTMIESYGTEEDLRCFSTGAAFGGAIGLSIAVASFTPVLGFITFSVFNSFQSWKIAGNCI